MKKSSTRMWYVIGVGVVILILMMLVASVIQIGEQLKNIHEYVAYGFYGLAALLLYLLIIRPVAIILYSPSFSVETTLDKNPKRAYKVFKQVARRLLEQEELSDAIKENIKQSMKDPHKLRDAMNNAYNHDIKKRMNKSIQNHARTVLISTAISQNGRLDFITVIVVNIQMIKDLVVMCGFRPSYKNLAKLVVNVFTTALIAEGLEIVSGGTDNHLLLVNVKSVGLTGKVAEKVLDEVGITVNKNTIPYDQEKPFVTSGIRIGTPAVTSRGFLEEDMKEVGLIIAKLLKNPEDAAVKQEAADRVKVLTDKYPIYEDLVTNI